VDGPVGEFEVGGQVAEQVEVMAVRALAASRGLAVRKFAPVSLA
jgi:hypothetical protein